MSKDIIVKLYELRQLAMKSNEDKDYIYTLYRDIEKYINSSQEKMNNIIEYIEETNSEEAIGADYFIIKDYFEELLEIIKGEN